jgi:hypothetical protein
MTVRQVFYQATVRGIVEKEESGYNKVQTDLTGPGTCLTTGSRIIRAGNASRAASTASSRHCRRLRNSIVKTCGPTPNRKADAGCRRCLLSEAPSNLVRL